MYKRQISGTLTAPLAASNYTVTATNSGGPQSFTVNISANYPALTGLSYTTPQVLTVDTFVSITPTLNPAGYSYPLTYSVLPALPTGLTLDTGTGEISGTLTAPLAASNYTVTATNSGGPQSFTVNISANYPALTGLSYTTPQVLTVGTGVNIAPSLNPPAYAYPLTYSVLPALPTGLTLDPSTGEITGSPSSEQSGTWYSVTAQNSGGSQSTGIFITINPSLPAVTTALPVYNSLTTADAGGDITDTGGGTITQHGVCWNTTGNPTISDPSTTLGTGAAGPFTCAMTGLTVGLTYHVRAYAVNSAGTAYGAEVVYAHGSLLQPNLTTVRIESGIVPSVLARVGTIITLTFISDMAIQTPNVSIAGHDELDGVTVTGGGTSWQATYTMVVGDSEGTIPFTISNIQSLLFVSAPNVSATTDGSSVTFDRTAPTVSIDAPSQTLINGSGSVDFGITYTGASTVNLTQSDVTLTAVGANCGNIVVTDGATMNPTVTLSACTGTGTVAINIGANTSSDAAGNTNDLTGPSALFTVDTIEPNITPVTFRSSNPINNAYARDGHTITVQFTTDEAVVLPTVFIGTYPAAITDPTGGGTGMTWEAAYAVASGSDEEVGYSISVADLAGNPDTDTAPGGVTIDNTAPTIDHVEKWPADNVYGEGETITIQVQFVETIRLETGSMDVTLNTTPVNAVVNFNAPWGGPTNFIGMGYQVQAGEESANLKVVSIGTSGGQIVDEAGNEMTVFTGFTNYPDGIILDGVAPTVVITAPSGGTSVNGNAVIGFTESEPNTPEVSLDNITWIGTVNGVTLISDVTGFASIPENNPFTLYLRGTDAAGNVGSHSISLTKDTTPPTVSFTSTPDINFTNQYAYSVTGSCSEEGLQVRVNIGGDADFVTCTGNAFTRTVDASGFSETSISMTAEHWDAAGNDDSVSTSVNKDTVAPVVFITAPADSARVNGDAVISFNDDDPNAPEVSLDGFTWTPADNGVTRISDMSLFFGFTEGIGFTLYLRDTDAAGNVGTHSINLTKDTAAPTVTITSPTDGSPVNGSAVISFTGSDLNAPEVSLDNATWIPAANGVTRLSDISGFGGVPEGSGFTLYLRDTDTAGNASTVFISLTKDTTAPQLVEISSDTDNDTYSSSAAIDIRLTFDEVVILPSGRTLNMALTGMPYTVTINSFTGQVVHGTFTVSPGDSTYGSEFNVPNVWVTGGPMTDLAGNETYGFTIPTSNFAFNKDIFIDAVPPTVTVESPFSGADYSTNVAAQTISGSCSTDAAMTGTTMGTFTDTGGVDGWWSLDVTLPGEGTYTITVTATDGATNTGDDSMTVTYDTTAPGVSWNSVPAINFNNRNAYTVTGYCDENGQQVAVTVSDGINPDVEDYPICGAVVSNEFATASLDVSGLSEGSVEVSADHADAAGNNTHIQITRTKDTVAPVVFITAPGDGSRVSGNTVISFNDDDPNTPEVSLDNATWIPAANGSTRFSDMSMFSGLPENSGFTLYLRDTDAAGNIGTHSISLTKDTLAPTVTITSSASPGPTSDSPIPISIDFSEEVIDFYAGLITVTNGSVSGLMGSGANYTAEIMPAGFGTVTVDIAAGVVFDGAGNPNDAAPQFSISYLNNDASLSNLTLSPSGSWTPAAFSSGTTYYSVIQPNSVPMVDVTATVNDLNASVMINGMPGASRSVSLTPGIGTTIIVLVTAQDGTTTLTYTLDVYRNTPPEINVAQSSPSGLTYNFGDIYRGQNSGAITFTIENLGDENLQITNWGITGDSGDFSCNLLLPTISGHSSRSFQNTFTPQYSGQRDAFLTIY
ncbi:MAG: putative Ig domain-containing protein [Phycisphaerae bacterium]|nr:putative Ig domain-containing protein [Phycisphaerae bacterium]